MNNIPILLYHKVKNFTSSTRPSAKENDFCISVDTFEKQMKYLKEKGYSSIDFYDLTRLNSRSFIITFDDGYEDIYLNAYPILKKYGFTATIFLVADYIGKTNIWDNTGEKLLTESQINELLQNSFSIGSHTLTHPHLTKENEKECLRQIAYSKIILEDRFNVEIKTFSYPYNEFNDKIKEIVEKAGYGFACAISTKSKSVLEDKFAIRRIYVKANDTMLDFKRKISGVYLFYRGLMGK